MKSLVLEDIEIEIQKKNIKNLNLTIDLAAGKVRMSVPLDAREEEIRYFAFSKIAWIKKKQAISGTRKKPSSLEYLTGEVHFFLGQPYRLHVIETKKSQYLEIKADGSMNLYIRPGSTKDKREKLILKEYRQKLKEMIPEMIKKWEGPMGVRVEEFGIKNMKTRWGTCNIAEKRIWVNLELAKKEEKFLEYILVHEMVHLLERRHSAKFKSYMDRFLPDWRRLREELNEGNDGENEEEISRE